jgi:hypothetical protein
MHEGQERFPAYGLDEAYRPLPALAPTLEHLGPISGWRNAIWFESSNAWLGGAKPRECLAALPATPDSGRRLAPPLLLQAPRLVWRVHAARFSAAEFHPGGRGSARFSPIESSKGTPVPTLYLASTLDGALMESVFREVPTPPGEYILDLDRLRDAQMVASCLRVDRRLRLVDLSTKGLKRLGLTRARIVDTSVLEYARTRAFSARLHHTTKAQGLVWTSKQDDNAKAYLLYGDRIPASALRIVEDRVSLLEEPQLTSLISLATRIGVTRVYSG